MTTTKTTKDAFAYAQDRAKSKAIHGRPAGALDLTPRPRYSWGEGGCQGQLRTAYVRLSVQAPTAPRVGYQAGKPTWSPIGVVCEACRAFWPAPVE